MSACTGADAEDLEDVEEADAALTAAGGSDRPPPYGTNGLVPACFWSSGSQQALRSLGARALSAANGAMPPVSLNQVSAACREVLADTVQCALPEGEALHDPVTGADYEGRWGLAPSWKNGPLDQGGRRYVTGCLLQRLNASGVHVPILLEGANPAIAANPTYQADFGISESTMFGDLFSSTTPLTGSLPAFNAYVCWEDDLPQSCGLLGLPLLGQRICDDLVLCGLIPLGPCTSACIPSGPYWQCKPGLLPTLWPQTVRVRRDTEDCH